MNFFFNFPGVTPPEQGNAQSPITFTSGSLTAGNKSEVNEFRRTRRHQWRFGEAVVNHERTARVNGL